MKPSIKSNEYPDSDCCRQISYWKFYCFLFSYILRIPIRLDNVVREHNKEEIKEKEGGDDFFARSDIDNPRQNSIKATLSHKLL